MVSCAVRTASVSVTVDAVVARAFELLLIGRVFVANKGSAIAVSVAGVYGEIKA